MAIRSVATSDTLETFRTSFNSLGTDVGDLNSLTTTDKTSIIAAINEARGATFAFTLRDSSSTTQVITGNDTLNVVGDTNIAATVSATDTFTVSLNTTVTGLTSLTSTTLTDGTLTVTGGNITGAGSFTGSGTITGGTITDGTASLSGGNITGAGSFTGSGTITGGTITDGTASLSSGSISSAVNGNFSGTVTGGTITDGTASLSSGSISSAVNGNFSGTVTANAFSGDGDSLTGLNISTDSTPQLGGNLDVNSNSIVSVSDGDIAITPNGTGSVIIDGLSHPQADGATGQFLKTDGAGNLAFATVNTDLSNDTTPQLGGDLDLNSSDITGTGNINITGDLDISNDTQTDSLGVGTAASGTTGEIRATNDVTAFYSSDVTLKENIVNIPDPIEALKKLNGVLFDWKKSYIDERGGEDGYFVRKKDVGVIAQDVEKVLPEAVAQRPNGVKAVKYDRLTCLLIEAVKKLNDKVENLTK